MKLIDYLITWRPWPYRTKRFLSAYEQTTASWLCGRPFSSVVNDPYMPTARNDEAFRLIDELLLLAYGVCSSTEQPLIDHVLVSWAICSTSSLWRILHICTYILGKWEITAYCSAGHILCSCWNSREHNISTVLAGLSSPQDMTTHSRLHGTGIEFDLNKLANAYTKLKQKSYCQYIYKKQSKYIKKQSKLKRHIHLAQICWWKK
jgi:hypothetical protein